LPANSKMIFLMKNLLLFVFLSFSFANIFGQVAINADGSAADASAMVDIKSTTSGLLIPRMLTSDRDNISSPATGLTVYVTDENHFYYYDGVQWVKLEVSGKSWLLDGNAGTDGTQFLGTTDAQPVIFKTNNVERARINENGFVGINVAPNDLYVVSVEGSENDRIGSFRSTRANSDDIAVYGESNQSDYYGIGGDFKAGWIGIRSTIAPTGSQYYYGINSSVKGGSGTNYGILSSADGDGENYGVKGQATGTNATLRYGVYGYSTGDDTDNHGVYGEAFGNSNTNRGVYGVASGDTNNIGVYGTAEGGNDNVGVFGEVAVADDSGAAGFLKNNHDTGIGLIVSGNNQSLYYITDGAGIVSTGADLGVVGYATNSGNNVYGGYFLDGNDNYAYVAGRNRGTDYKIMGNGSVSTIVSKSSDEEVVMFAPEAPEIFFQDFGQGQLVDGKARIKLDPIFARNITVNDKHPLRVIVQLEGECNGVYVTNKTKKGFEVVELQNGKSNVKFTYFVTANRADRVDAKGNVRSKNADVRFPLFTKPKLLQKQQINTKKNKVNKQPTFIKKH